MQWISNWATKIKVHVEKFNIMVLYTLSNICEHFPHNFPHKSLWNLSRTT